MRVLTTVMGQKTNAAVARDMAPREKVFRLGMICWPSLRRGQCSAITFCALLRHRK